MTKKSRTKKQKALWDRMKEWVETKGIYPEPLGGTITAFCRHFGIDVETYRDWVESKERTDFPEMIKNANEVYRQKIVESCEVGLLKLCRGYEDWEEFQEGMPDGKGGVLIKKLSRRKKIVPPNLGALTFVLCNREPQKWTNPLKIDATVKGGLDVVLGITPEEAGKYLDKMNSIEVDE